MTIYLATLIFFVVYVFIALEKFNRVALVCFGSAAMLVVGATDAESMFYDHATGVDWQVIFLLLGMMIIVGIIHKTGLFEYLAIRALKIAGGRPKLAYASLLVLVAFASALLDNVTTILLAVPMTFLVTRFLRVSPIPFILGEVFVSNIGGAATLIGDPPNIIIGSKANLSFNDFLIHMTPISVIVLLVVIPLLVLVFRKQLVNTSEDRKVVNSLNARDFITDSVLLVKSIVTLGLVIVAFVLHSVLHLEPAVVALLGAGLLVWLSGLKVEDYAKGIEWGTLVFFAGLFIMVGALVNVGALGIFADWIVETVGDSPAVGATGLVLISAIVSGIVDNIPYVASMIPVVAEMESSLGITENDGLWWALALGADFGGNMTIVGASANVVALGLAAAQGVKITFWQFAKYGIPVTLISVALALPYVLVRYF